MFLNNWRLNQVDYTLLQSEKDGLSVTRHFVTDRVIQGRVTLPTELLQTLDTATMSNTQITLHPASFLFKDTRPTNHFSDSKAFFPPKRRNMVIN